MKVVGHVDQLHRSRCYQASGDLSCTTCHDPHAPPRTKDRLDYYRAICLGCHDEASCRLEPGRRKKESPEDDCVSCHMPTVPTEIRHLAFTHHRIGIHPRLAEAPETKPRSPQPGVLEPFHDLSRFDDLDRKRSLGMAYAELATSQRDPALTAAYDRRAAELLRPLVGRGLREAAVEYILYMIENRNEYGPDVVHAEKSLSLPCDSIHFRCEALYAVARARCSRGRYEEAHGLLKELVRLRRDHRDWLLLAACEEGRGDQAAAVQALETALRINTAQPALHKTLAEYYRRQGNVDRANWHSQRAVAP
jgi:predicted CXXCH cytochrome family protein